MRCSRDDDGALGWLDKACPEGSSSRRCGRASGHAGPRRSRRVVIAIHVSCGTAVVTGGSWRCHPRGCLLLHPTGVGSAGPPLPCRAAMLVPGGLLLEGQPGRGTLRCERRVGVPPQHGLIPAATSRSAEGRGSKNHVQVASACPVEESATDILWGRAPHHGGSAVRDRRLHSMLWLSKGHGSSPLPSYTPVCPPPHRTWTRHEPQTSPREGDARASHVKSAVFGRLAQAKEGAWPQKATASLSLQSP